MHSVHLPINTTTSSKTRTMHVNESLISKLEELALLRLTESEKMMLTKDLEKIIDMFSLIAEVDTSDVEPLRHMNEVYNVMREDVPAPSLSIEEVRGNAPRIINDQFAVPKVIE
ncbi:MAG: Asp-tRNA(Asn)/Glu-tRNA(Gln) amidotransferase subunit GatC [Saprospiraceae bacterium]|nr:Asp-tRNA(Asn)/Glu-tRNA(Gln) amidotransferase subunit GatC [Saprospiraceae bacterium]